MTTTKVHCEPTVGEVYRCERCGEKLNPARMVWLELNTLDGTYNANVGEVPEGESQGCFTFGAACARAVVENAGELVRI